MPTHICPMKNWQLVLTLTHWSYSKFKDILQTLNLYKIPSKQHQVVDYSDADEISVSKILFWKYLDNVPIILRNYKKTKQDENCQI